MGSHAAAHSYPGFRSLDFAGFRPLPGSVHALGFRSLLNLDDVTSARVAPCSALPFSQPPTVAARM